jgi:diguanylate cyclase (GGDEF)-like protein/PAS domain S-box-containing protein
VFAFRTIRYQLIGLVLVAVVPLLALTGGILWTQWGDNYAAALQRAVHEARALAARIDGHISTTEALLTGLSQTLSVNAADAAANDAVLQRVKAGLPDYISSLALFSDDGSNIGASLQVERGRLYAGDRAYFREALAGERLVVGDPVRGRINQQWLMPIARPVKDDQGRVRAVLAAFTRLDVFHALQTQELPPGSVVRIVNKQGIVVGRSPNSPNWIGRDVSGVAQVARHLAAGEAGEPARWGDGIERVTASSTARRAPWLVSVGLPSNFVLAAMSSRLRWELLFAIATLVMASWITWEVSRRIVEPLRCLQSDAMILASGRLSHRSAVAESTEIDALAHSLNSMAQSLEARQLEAESSREDLRRARTFLDAVVEHMPAMLFVKDAHELRFVLINRAGEELVGLSRDTLIGRNDYDLFPREQADFFVARDREALQSGEVQLIAEEPIQTRHRGQRLLQTRKLRILDGEGQPQYLLGVSEDITDRKRMEETERQAKETLAAVIDASPVAIICVAPDRQVMVWSRAAEEIFGYTAQEAVGQPYKLVPPEGRAEFEALVARTLHGEILRDVEVRRQRKDGSLVDVSFSGAAMYDRGGVPRGVAYALQDITERKKDKERLQRLAFFDPLTGLPNRASLQADLAKLLAGEGAGPAPPFAVAVLDLDNFKDVNDTLGHSIGDQLLTSVADRLKGASGSGTRLYHLGGDEFVLVLESCADPLAAVAFVNSTLRDLAQPFSIHSEMLHVRASLGVALAPSDASTAEDLIASAGLALYQAKAAGKATYRLFVPTLRAQAQARRSLLSELRRAFDDNEFELHFQPQVRLSDGAVIGAEALLRWQHPQKGILLPGAFIDMLASSDIAAEVGDWILQTACAHGAAWRAKGLAPIRLGVNLFPAQFHEDSLVAHVEAALRETDLPTTALELEITENIALGHNQALVAPLRKLRDMGVHLAFDDFGTGYASLSCLTRYPISRVKIDQSFVRKISDNAADATIVQALIGLAHNLGLEVCAEGVETLAQAAFLEAKGCEEAQGYLYAKPLDTSEFEAFLRRAHARASIAENAS